MKNKKYKKLINQMKRNLRKNPDLNKNLVVMR